MNGAIKTIKNKIQGSPNTKKIQNYTYFTDLVVGSGNFSTVYQATTLTKREKITVKIVNMKSLTFKKLQELLDQEINIILTLNHTNIIKCFDVFKTSEECYIFTQLCEKGTLDQHIKEKGTLTEEEAWPFIKDIFQGLKYLHSKNIIHRDIKPANIFLKSETLKIADFGFAIQSRQHIRDMNIGSPLYMSPEGYIDNIYGPKTDVWAFGIVLYELLHGKTPNSHLLDTESLRSNITVPIRRQDFRNDISYDLKDLILRCLEINQSKRISIKQIENHYYMGRRLQNQNQQPTMHPSLSYQRININDSQLSRYNSTNIIRFPSKIMINHSEKQDTRLSVKVQRPTAEYHTATNYKNVIRIRSSLRICDEKSPTDSSTSAESNPESPTFQYSKHQTDKVKDDVRVTSYQNYLKRNSHNCQISVQHIK